MALTRVTPKPKLVGSIVSKMRRVEFLLEKLREQEEARKPRGAAQIENEIAQVMRAEKSESFKREYLEAMARSIESLLPCPRCGK